ncbi:SDR family NAD(P)-dependent oxidoreductase, partial [Klebsiella aerogenes]|uniref:SDR family NAD(P)-dependent oxidoreductase n=3 Tax=Pseudomonadota TaxID=1224 RepID=UPI0013D30ECB
IADAESQALVTGLAGLGQPPVYEHVDLTDVAGARARIARLIEDHGSFDILVNNAANDDRHTIEEVTEEYWENRLNVN